MSDIFLSYASEDRERVRPLSAALVALGWNVFWDVETPPGETWRHFIETQLQQARCFVVVWSKISVASEWVLEEADEARSQDKHRLSVVIDDLDKLPFGHRGPQAASLVGWQGDTRDPRFQTLVAVLEDWLGEAPAKADREREWAKDIELAEPARPGAGSDARPAAERVEPGAETPPSDHGVESGPIEVPGEPADAEGRSRGRAGSTGWGGRLRAVLGVVVGLAFAAWVFLQVLEEQRPKEDRIDEVIAEADALFRQARDGGFEPADLVGLPARLAGRRQDIDRLEPDRYQREAVDERFFAWFIELARVAAERRERSLASVALEYAEGLRPGDPQIAELRDAIAVEGSTGARQPWVSEDRQIGELLAEARRAFDQQRLTRPAEGSALALYREVLRRDPGNAEAQRGLEAIVDWYLGRVGAALDGRELDAAADYLARAEQVRADHPGVRAAAARLEALTAAQAAARPANREADRHRPGEAFRDALRDGGQGPEMMVVPAGEYRMGDLDGGGSADERPVHRVEIARPFAVGRYEVSFDEYERFARATGREVPNDQGWGRGRRPVIHVNWEDASAYAEWLSAQTGRPYRLPTEAEWEYAARAGTETAYWWGPEVGQGRANCAGCGGEGGRTVPGGSFEPNGFGFYDTAGNVWEWTLDCWHETYEGEPADGSAWLDADGGDCRRRVVRGGSWSGLPRYVRSAVRFGVAVDDRINDLGFRLARDIE